MDAGTAQSMDTIDPWLNRRHAVALPDMLRLLSTGLLCMHMLMPLLLKPTEVLMTNLAASQSI